MTAKTHCEAIQPWKTRARQLVLAARPWLQVYREEVELPSGRIIDDFYRVVTPDFVNVVAVTDRDEIVMVRGYKHGLEHVTLSTPAGYVNPDELPLAAAQRELLEETGYEAGHWQPLGSFVVDGNRQCGRMHAYLASKARPSRSPEADEMEELRVELLSRERVQRALREGEIGNLAGAAAVALALLSK